MKKINFFKTSIAIALMLTVGACSKNSDKNITQQDHPKVVTTEMMAENGANPDEASIKENSGTASSELNSPVSEGSSSGHYLYTESNASEANSILTYKIKNNGSLYFNGASASGGSGTGKGLGSQGALVLDKKPSLAFCSKCGKQFSFFI